MGGPRSLLPNIWEMGDWSVNWNINDIHGTQLQAYRNRLDLVRTPNRTPAQNANLDYYASFPARLPSYVINDIQVNYKAPWNATITLGVNNVANKEPVYDRSTGGTSYNANLYDPWGRIPYIRYTQRF